MFLTNGLEFGKPTFLERKAYPLEKRWQFTDNVTLSRGAFTIKFGADINHVSDVLDNLRFETPGFSYGNINDFVIDYTNWKTPLAATAPCVATSANRVGRCYSGSLAYQQGFGVGRAEIATNDYSFYAQMDWKFNPRVTFNLGLRYEYENLPEANSKYKPDANSEYKPHAPAGTSTLPNDKNNFGPRAGFAMHSLETARHRSVGDTVCTSGESSTQRLEMRSSIPVLPEVSSR